MRYEDTSGEEVMETTTCRNCGGKVVLKADATDDTCDSCIEEEVRKVLDEFAEADREAFEKFDLARPGDGENE